MGIFDESDSSRPRLESAVLATDALPKLTFTSRDGEAPILKVSQNTQHRYLRDEITTHPFQDKADVMLPRKFKDDRTFDPVSRVFEPSSLRPEEGASTTAGAPLQQTAQKPAESTKDAPLGPTAPERNLFGGSSGDSGAGPSPELSIKRSSGPTIDPPRSRGSDENSLFAIIVGSLAAILAAFFKMIGRVLSPRSSAYRSRRYRSRR